MATTRIQARLLGTRIQASALVALLIVAAGCGSSSSGVSTSTVLICEFAEIDSYWDVLARSDAVVRGTLLRETEEADPEDGVVWDVQVSVLQGDSTSEITQIAVAGRGDCNWFAAYRDDEFVAGREGIFFLADGWNGEARHFGDPDTRYWVGEHPWAVFYNLDELEDKITQVPFPVGTAATRRLTEEVGALPLARFTPPGFLSQ